ncbi:DNA topoisomerase III [Nematocida sp. AWRm78]|nr:DNA topoisomerase III [Nematocida sp. AWRm79]KAI5184193.1 DNA topoisomerase III [Nematocida sp. AWRm78]
MRILNVAEKPSVAKSLADILSNGRAEFSKGYNKYCSVFRFNHCIEGIPCEMVFTSVLGHLYSLEFARKTSWTEIDPIELFEEDVRWIIPKEMADVSRTLVHLSKDCDMLIIWTDCDREGENIGMQVANLVRDRIREVKRARFSGLSKYDVMHAVENLCRLNTYESKAVESRIEIDLRIGAALTRLQTLQLQSILDNKSVISYGSCQIPTLGFVCEREESIEEFVEESNWTIEAEVQNNGEKGVFKWERGVVYDEDYADIKLSTIAGEELVVNKVEIKKRHKSRPWPLRTVELQKFFARGHGVSSSHELMNIAESLYTSGYISYPRTETDVFSSQFNYKDPLAALKGDSVLSEYAKKLVPGRPSAGRHNDQAHTPIYPLKAGSGLKGKERAVYEYIARRFLACYSADAEGEEELIECQVKEEKFIRKTLKVTKKNYLEIFIYEKWGDTEIDLALKEGQTVKWAPNKKESHTNKPHLLTEAELIAKMDNNGIGTDATIHDHIERIKTRMYIEVINKNSIRSTWLGRSLINGYKSIGLTISQPYLRKEFECNLKRVCSGEFPSSDLITQEIIKYKEIYTIMEKNMPKFKEEFTKNKTSGNGGGIEEKNQNRYTGYKKIEDSSSRTKTQSYSNISSLKSRYQKPNPLKPVTSGYAGYKAENHYDSGENRYTKKKKEAKEPFDGINIEGSFKTALDINRATINNRPISDILKQKEESCIAGSDASNNSFVLTLPKGTIVCGCNIKAKEAMVKKEGPNKGKLFYTCSAGQCDYFGWGDSVNVQKSSEQAKPYRKENQPAKNRNIKPMIKDSIKCDCGASAIYLLSKTEKNKNRGFFKCNKNYKPCTFFKWEDEATQNKN